MRLAWRGLWRELVQFRRVEQGAAAVEFALILPVMLTLYVGAVEASALISMDRKLQSVTGTLGDLIARWDTTIPAEMVEDYFQAASGIMTPHPTDGLEQMVTQVRVINGVATVDWSQQYHDGVVSQSDKYDDGDSFPLPAAMVSIVPNGYVIVAEGRYAYPPLYGLTFQHTVNLYRENFFVPRFGGSITIE